MGNRVLGSLCALLVSTGLASAQGSFMRAPGGKTGESGAPVAAVPIPSPEIVDGALVPVSGDGALPANECLTIEGACASGYSLWGGAEYLLWWYKKNQFPALLTVGPLSSGGVPGAAGVRTIGGDNLDENNHSGYRIFLGGWFTEYQAFGIEGSFFQMESKSFNFGAAGTGGTGTQLVGRPFFDLLNGRAGVRGIAIPGATSGSAFGTTFGQCTGSSRLMGAEFHFLMNLCCDCDYRVDLLVGYRYAQLDDRFSITENSVGLGGLATTITDQFNTGNRFSGGQLGLRSTWKRGRLGAQVTGTVALGSNDEVLDSAGVTTLFGRGGLAANTITVPAGFLAVPGNSGNVRCEHFAVIPEVNGRLSFEVLDCLHVFAGYSFLYWSNVARSGDNVNRNVNLLEVPTAVGGVPGQSPRRVDIRTTDFWAHGINAGIEFRY